MRRRHRVRLVHWDAFEAAERAKRLRGLGYEVDASPLDGAALLRETRQRPPAAVVIDLTRLPSQGRDLALALRERPASRAVPVVFVAGDPVKVKRIRALLPDAVYASWTDLGERLAHAISNPVKNPAVRNRMDAYARTPLARKLGIGPGSVVSLLRAPRGFEDALGDLPDGVAVKRGGRASSDITIFFATKAAGLDERIDSLAERAGNGGLWILWPKAASGRQTDLTQVVVRRTAEGAGLVDYEIARIDETWSGLKFTRKRGGLPFTAQVGRTARRRSTA